jgi:NAD-dependent SIR2 family protein deacetylase
MVLDAHLVAAVKSRSAMLFVGAGVSRTLGLPSFGELIDDMGRELGYDPELFSSYGALWTLAEYYKREHGTLGDLRSRLDSAWHSGIDIATSPIHRYLVRLQPALLYTTNWDRWLERAFDHYGVTYQTVRHVGVNAHRKLGHS